MTDEATAHVPFVEGQDTDVNHASGPAHAWSVPSAASGVHAQQAGDVAGKYRLMRSLGRGGMGEVFEAVHVHTSRRVAVKILHAHGGSGTQDDTRERQTRFAREAQIIGQIRSPHVVEVYDAGTTGGDDASAFIAMELMHGEDLGAVLSRQGPLPVDTVLKIAVQAARGLAAAHEAGIVHRDIKPANLFLADHHERAGSTLTLKILDFGVARITAAQPGVDLTQDLTHTGTVVGSPAYMPPEQVRGRRDLDHRADVWSLSAALYKLLCGRTPHVLGDSGIGELLVDICCKPAEPVRARAAWVPMDVSDAIMRGLELDPNARYATMHEMLATFQKLLGEAGEVIRATDIHALDEREKRAVRGALSRARSKQRSRQLAATLALSTLGAAALGGMAALVSTVNARGYLDPLQAPRAPYVVAERTPGLLEAHLDLEKAAVIPAPDPIRIGGEHKSPCSANQELVGGQCVPRCPPGSSRIKGVCVSGWDG